MSKQTIDRLVGSGRLTQMIRVGRYRRPAARRILLTGRYRQFAETLRKEARTRIVADRLEQLLSGIAAGDHVNNRAVFRRLDCDIFEIRVRQRPPYRLFCMFPYPDCIVLLSGMRRADIRPDGWRELAAENRAIWDALAPDVPPFRADRFDAYITIGATHHDW